MTVMPANPITCITDAFGNFWVLTTYGTCGSTNPFLTNLTQCFRVSKFLQLLQRLLQMGP